MISEEISYLCTYILYIIYVLLYYIYVCLIYFVCQYGFCRICVSMWNLLKQNSHKTTMKKTSYFPLDKLATYCLLPLSLNFLMIWSYPLIRIGRDLMTQNSICWEDWTKKFKIRPEKLRVFMDWQGPKSFFFGDKDDIGIYWNPYHPWDWYICLHGWFIFMVNGCYGKYSSQFNSYGLLY